ncbi:unnamed protein product [Caenorhabditis brenneri]
MSHHFRENKEVYQGFILSQVILETPCWEAYKLACKIRREDINYRDFEFIYMKFSAGHTELDVEVPKWTEQDDTLDTMPDPILRIILNSVDLQTRFITRKVSKKFEILVDSTERCCSYVSISMCAPQYFKLEIDNYCIKYDIKSNTVTLRRCEKNVTKHFIKDPLVVFLNDLKIVFKALKMRTFSIYVVNGYEEEHVPLLLSTLQQIRDNTKRDFKAKALYICYGNMAAVLPLLKIMRTPFLKKLEISVRTGETTIDPEIFLTDQWRNLKKFESQNSVEPSILLRSFVHLGTFEVHSELSSQQALQLIQTLAASTTFRSCMIRLDRPDMMISELAEALNVRLESDETSKFMKLDDTDGAILISVEYFNHIDDVSLDIKRKRSLG